MKRREFLRASALGMSGLITGTSLLRAEAPATKYDPFATVALGKTKIKTSRLCMGTGVRGGNRESNHTRMGKEKLHALIRGAYDQGVRCFDLADLYGTHPYVIPALKEIPRDKYTIFTKQWCHKGGLPEADRPDADVVIPRFLKELGTDYIDLVLLHCLTSAKWPEEMRKQMDILSKFKEKGVIRALGVSCHSIEALEAAAEDPWVESVHARINPYGLVMDGSPDKVLPVIRKLRDKGKAIVGMKIIGEGKLRDDDEKRTASVRFALKEAKADILNVGFEKISEIEDLAERVRKA
jgi:aryl-alcohol dehydrogenase-like predicted oxidoreductase